MKFGIHIKNQFLGYVLLLAGVVFLGYFQSYVESFIETTLVEPIEKVSTIKKLKSDYYYCVKMYKSEWQISTQEKGFGKAVLAIKNNLGMRSQLIESLKNEPDKALAYWMRLASYNAEKLSVEYTLTSNIKNISKWKDIAQKLNQSSMKLYNNS